MSIAEHILRRIEALERAFGHHHGASIGGCDHTGGKVYDRFAEETRRKFEESRKEADKCLT